MPKLSPRNRWWTISGPQRREARLLGPQMKDGAPSQLYVPQVLASTTFMIDGERVNIEEPESYAAYVWIPSAKPSSAARASRGVFTSGRRIPKRRKAANSGSRRWIAWQPLSPNTLFRATTLGHRQRVPALWTLPVAIYISLNRPS